MRGESERPPNPVSSVIVIPIAAAIAAIGFALLSWPAATDATVDPHDSCTGGVTSIEPDVAQNIATYDASPDIVTGVCIKSGSNMFGGDHSPLFTVDTANIENCYTITGIGTASVTVQRTGAAGPNCQGISHIDVLVGEQTPTPTPTSTPAATPTVQPPGETPTPTPTPTSGVLGETRGPTALPATGQRSGARPSDELLLLSALGALLAIGGTGAVAVAARRRP